MKNIIANDITWFTDKKTKLAGAKTTIDDIIANRIPKYDDAKLTSLIDNVCDKEAVEEQKLRQDTFDRQNVNFKNKKANQTALTNCFDEGTSSDKN